ncbi:P-loop containing nucleoside triphosphate hydrolase protein [Mycena albidolilacea]|uniref:P-loop containing nucleoside triphosphate hydrolase protein n=1 Tax=Mycena albidolilacea TaxID=1033008 RepID=A0AAD6ZA17_9AGAR|nr:P-loop containing nucleoside triphosphate hydrolase protein [Mycena albidolilacea]
MDTHDHSIYQELRQALQDIRQKSLPALQALAFDILPSGSYPSQFIDSLDDTHKTISLRACLLVVYASKRTIIPRQYQLETMNALEDGRDILVDSGTGSGKTLCMIIPNLMHPHTTSITISPLKRLQITQVTEFQKWGINAISINEDTPNTPELWNHLIVQPEQLGSFHGHMPRLARLLTSVQFARKIARVHIDEIHFLYIAGLPHYGLPAFRPAWGGLNELRLRLPKGTPVQAHSGTLPPHIKSAVIEHLNFNPSTFLSLKLSTNRPNIVYVTHRIVGSLSDFRNLDFLISNPFTHIIKTVVYHDDTQQCADAVAFNERRLPPELRNTGLIRHYHGACTCKILHTTEGASTGLHVDDIVAVVDYGVTQKKLTVLQRAGRGGRRGQMAVYLCMAEPWAYSASLDGVEPNSTDPDRPIAGHLTKYSRKPARTGLAMVKYVRSKVCLRELIRQYLADESREALNVSYEWCCDLDHPNDPSRRFIYQDEDGRIYAGDVGEADREHLNPPKSRKRKANRLSNRRVIDRVGLQAELRSWVLSAHSSDPLRAVRPLTYILDAKAIKTLSTVHPDRLSSVSQVVAVLEETDEWEVEWGSNVFAVISAYDAELQKAAEISGAGKTKTATRAKGRKEMGGDDEYEPAAKRSRNELPLADVSTNVRRSDRLALK